MKAKRIKSAVPSRVPVGYVALWRDSKADSWHADLPTIFRQTVIDRWNDYYSFKPYPLNDRWAKLRKQGLVCCAKVFAEVPE